MKAQIATLIERMCQGGDWRAFRDEIAALHEEATTEEEYVTLLEAHTLLVKVAHEAFDEETCSEVRKLAAAEYRMFLIKEAMENGVCNPVLMERVTRREVEAGRLDPNDSSRTLAIAAAQVLGDSAELTEHTCKHGDWFFYGMGSAALIAAALARFSVSPLWLFALGLFVGWFINEREHKRLKAAIAARRSAGKDAETPAV